MNDMDKEFLQLLDNGQIDIDCMAMEDLNKWFQFLNGQMTTIYHFVLIYNEYINNRHAYTDEEALTMLEVHLLTDICDYPDSTVTSLANAWNRSVSATSQTIRKLIQKDLVTRENSKEDAKIFFLRPTEKGIRISDAHKCYDTLDTIKTFKRLRHSLSLEEIGTMFKGIKAYSELLRRGNMK